MLRRHRAAKRNLQIREADIRSTYVTDDGSRSVGSRRYSPSLAKPPTHGKPEEYRKRERLSYFRGNTEDMPMPADPEGSGRQWVEHWYRRGRNTARVYNPTQCSSVGTSRVCVLPMILSNAYKCGRGAKPCAKSHTYKLTIYGKYIPYMVGTDPKREGKFPRTKKKDLEGRSLAFHRHRCRNASERIRAESNSGVRGCASPY